MQCILVLLILCLSNFEVLLAKQGSSRANEDKPLALVALFSHFGPEFLDRNRTPFLYELKKSGESASHVNSPFPPNSPSIIRTISTGLPPKFHGVYNEYGCDKQMNGLSDEDLYDYDDEIRSKPKPFWIINELNGGRSGCMMWPGCQFKYNNKRITHIGTHGDYIDQSWEKRATDAIGWFTHPKKPANLVSIYFEGQSIIDYGPYSDQSNKYIEKVDEISKFMYNRLKIAKLHKKVNMIFLSDHALDSVPPNHIIDLSVVYNQLWEGSFKICGSSPVLQVQTWEGHEEIVYLSFKKLANEYGTGFKVYRTKDLPAEWKANNPDRFGSVIIIADPNFGFQDLYNFMRFYPYYYEHRGLRKYEFSVATMSPRSMRGIYIAFGPSMLSNVEVEPFNSIEIFNKILKTLDIKYSIEITSDDESELISLDTSKTQESEASFLVASSDDLDPDFPEYSKKRPKNKAPSLTVPSSMEWPEDEEETDDELELDPRSKTKTSGYKSLFRGIYSRKHTQKEEERVETKDDTESDSIPSVPSDDLFGDDDDDKKKWDSTKAGVRGENVVNQNRRVPKYDEQQKPARRFSSILKDRWTREKDRELDPPQRHRYYNLSKSRYGTSSDSPFQSDEQPDRSTANKYVKSKLQKPRTPHVYII